MKQLKKIVALLLMLVFVGGGVLSDVGSITQVEAASKISVKKKTLKQGENSRSRFQAQKALLSGV